MKIAIDARWIFPAPSGIGVYTRELITHLARIDHNNQYCLIFNDQQILDQTAETTGFTVNSKVTTALVPYGLFAPMGQMHMPDWLIRQGVDVFHSTNYMIPLRAFPRNRRGSIRCVITIHDVIPLKFPDHAPKARKSRLLPLFRWLMCEVGRRADRIITVSATSRNDVLAHLHLSPSGVDKVRVIYNGVAEQFFPGPGMHADDPSRPRTILYVGRADPYKNLINLVRAFAALKKEAPFPVRLKLVGATDPRYPEAPQMARELGVEADCEWSAAMTTAQLVDAYRQADLFVLPSRYEGFGIPAAEAMACGTPVLCGDCGALREVGGDAVLYVSPDDVPEMKRKMLQLLHDTRLARALATRGLQQVQRFTWRKTAEATLGVYEQLNDQAATAPHH